MALPRRGQALACPRIARPLIIFIGTNDDSANFWVWVRVGHASSGNRPGRRLSGIAPRVPVERTGPLSRKFSGSPEPGLPLFAQRLVPGLLDQGGAPTDGNRKRRYRVIGPINVGGTINSHFFCYDAAMEIKGTINGYFTLRSIYYFT